MTRALERCNRPLVCAFHYHISSIVLCRVILVNDTSVAGWYIRADVPDGGTAVSVFLHVCTAAGRVPGTEPAVPRELYPGIRIPLVAAPGAYAGGIIMDSTDTSCSRTAV